MKKKLFFLLVCFVMLTANIFAQSRGNSQASQFISGISQVPGSGLKVERKIYIQEDSKAEEILINIDKKTNQFALLIESEINKGKLTLEIYDSAGKKQGNFTIETQLSAGKREKVNGQFQKSWKNLPPGKWTVKIIPTSATASIYLVSSLMD